MNRHAETAAAMLDQAPPSRDSLEGVIHMLEANAEATLALAEAQDTANIIAVLAEYGPNLHDKTENIRIQYQSLTDELKTRMNIATTDRKTKS